MCRTHYTMCNTHYTLHIVQWSVWRAIHLPVHFGHSRGGRGEGRLGRIGLLLFIFYQKLFISIIKITIILAPWWTYSKSNIFLNCSFLTIKKILGDPYIWDTFLQSLFLAFKKSVFCQRCNRRDKGNISLTIMVLSIFWSQWYLFQEHLEYVCWCF